jgi:hypothetical protein
MKRVLIILAVFVGINVSAQEALVGDWMGELTTPQGSIRMVMHVIEADGGIDVTLDSPDQGPMVWKPIRHIRRMGFLFSKSRKPN